MRLILARHGQTDANLKHLLDTAAPGTRLNETGKRQAQDLAQRMAKESIQGIYASGILRTQETATPLAQQLGLEITVLPGLNEISAGIDELKVKWDRYIETLAAWISGNYQAQLPEGEKAQEFLARYDAAIQQVFAAGHDCALVVTHGAALRTWLGIRVAELKSACQHKAMENTAAICLIGEPGNWSCEYWDEQSCNRIVYDVG